MKRRSRKRNMRKYNELYISGQKATEFQAKIEKLNELVNNV